MNNESTYKANQPYKYDQSEDSRSSVVPPADLIHADQKVVLQLSATENHAIADHGLYGNPNFISALARTYNLHAEYEVSTWAYGNRHMAQQILPFMFLGPMSFARDADQVREAGITMMVAVRSKRVAEARPKIMDPARFDSAEGIECATFDVDSPFDIITGRAAILKRMNDHLEASSEGRFLKDTKQIPGKILVFCETGNERSPVLPVIYLMTIWGLNAFNAVQLVQARRFGIGLSTGIISMLQDVQDILRAERQVAAVGRWPSADPATSKKRNVDQAYEFHGNEEDSETESVKESIRSGQAPFTDGT